MSVRLMQMLTRGALAAALAVLTAGALLWLAQRPRWDFRHIELQGDLQHVTPASARAAIGGRLRGNFFTMRLDETRRLFEAVPWVARASVRRVWPGRLVVTLTEHRPLGVWDDGRLLSDTGELFVANVAEAEVQGLLPEFSGPPRLAREAARRYAAFAAALAPLSLTPESVAVSERASWSLVAGGGGLPSTAITLGRDETDAPVETRLATVVAAWPLVAARLGGPPARLDARHPNAFAAALPAKTK